MKILFISVSLFVSSMTFAECILPDGSSIREGQQGQLSLFDKDGSLENQSVQDQDGVSTCYANASSVLLKSVLKDKDDPKKHPDISFHDLALTSGADKAKKKADEKSKQLAKSKSKEAGKPVEIQYQDKQNSIGEYGHVCEAINAAKAKGGACPKSLSKLENQDLGDPTTQIRLYRGLSKYYDVLNKYKNDEKKLTELKQELGEIVEFFKQNQKIAKDNCKDHFIPRIRPTTDLLVRAMESEFKKDESCKPLKEAIKYFTTKGSSFKADRATLIVDNMKAFKFQKALQDDEQLRDNIYKWMDEGGEVSDELKKKAGEKINGVLNELYPKETFSKCKGYEQWSSQSYHPMLPNGIEAAGEAFLKESKIEKDNNCTEGKALGTIYTKTKDSIKDAACKYHHTDLVLEAIIPLIEMNQELDEKKLLDILSNPFSQEAKQLTDLLTPGCTKDQLIPLNNVSCNNVNLCAFDLHPGYETTTPYQGKKNTCYDDKKANEVFASTVIGDLKKGKALGIHTCPQYLLKPGGSKTKHCQVPGTAKFIHVMTVTGYRCMNGKLEYEVLNSFGKKGGCPKDLKPKKGQKAVDPKDQFFECIKDDKGNPVGRFWMKEDVLVDSTQKISTLSAEEDKK